MEQEHLAKILESILFTASRPIKAKELAKILELEEDLVKTTLNTLVETKKDDAIVLLGSNEGFQLATNSKYSTQVKNFLNAELREKLTDATVEVLAIIAYRQPISKAEIEAIRGVNSQYSIRHLLMRGMIEKVVNPSDARSVMYQTTTEFLMHMGVTNTKDLPEFEKLVEQIKLPETPALSQEAVTETSTELENTPVETTNIEPVQEGALINITEIENPVNEKLTESVEEQEDEDEDEDEDEKHPV